jgi:glycosyltransferase involved in cell wall biosynthesis
MNGSTSRRVLVVGDYPPPYGGVSVQVAALQRRLAALAGTTVAVLDIGVRRTQARAGCLRTRGAVDFATQVARHAGRGFIVHAHTNGHNTKSWLLAAVCAVAGLGYGRRTVISLGSGLMRDYLAGAHAGMRAVVRTTLRAAGAIIVRNERARGALLAMGAAPDAVRVLPGFYGVAGADVGRLPFAAARFRRTHHPVIGAIASVGPEYGLALLVDAAARLKARYPGLGVLLVGPDRLEDGHPSWVLPLGERDRPSLLAVVRELDAFVRPTYFDGDASSVREALALGVRVVASDTDYRPDGVRLFPRGDTAALADALDAALQAPAVTVEGSALPALLALYDALPVARGRRVRGTVAPMPRTTEEHPVA